MAILSNVNGKFAVEDTGAIRFSNQTGTTGQILKSNGNAAPTWIPQSDIVGAYLPLSGGTLTGATATASGISFTVGGTLTVNDNISTSADKRVSVGAWDNSAFTGGNAQGFSVQGVTPGLFILETDQTNKKSYLAMSSGAMYLGGSINFLALDTDGARALTLDSSQNATFAGTVTTTDVYGTSSLRTAALGGIHYVDASSSLIFRTSGSFTERMRIDQTHGDKTFISSYSGGTFPLRIGFGSYASFTPTFVINDSGNVGIGTSSPTYPLEINSAVTGGGMLSIMSTGVEASISHRINSGATNTGWVTGNYNADYFIYSYTLSSQAMTFKTSGNVGIGTTSPTSQLHVNNTSDGDKIRWGKSNALVGSVGTYNGVPYIGYQGGAGGGIMFNGLSIEPTALGATRSSSTNDIGSISYKWKDAYLSGGVFLGGHAAANKLNHYEKGTWTPTISHHDGSGVIPCTINQAGFVRVGQSVTLTAYITGINPNGNAGGSGLYYGFKGFPYAPSLLSTWNMVYVTPAVTSYGGYMAAASMYFNLVNANGTNGSPHANGATVNSWGSNWSCIISCTYIIA